MHSRLGNKDESIIVHPNTIKKEKALLNLQEDRNLLNSIRLNEHNGTFIDSQSVIQRLLQRPQIPPYNSNYLLLEKKIEAVATAAIPNAIGCTDVAAASSAGFWIWCSSPGALDKRLFPAEDMRATYRPQLGYSSRLLPPTRQLKHGGCSASLLFSLSSYYVWSAGLSCAACTSAAGCYVRMNALCSLAWGPFTLSSGGSSAAASSCFGVRRAGSPTAP